MSWGVGDGCRVSCCSTAGSINSAHPASKERRVSWPLAYFVFPVCETSTRAFRPSWEPPSPPTRPLFCASPHAWQLETIGAGRFPRCSSSKLSDFQSPRTQFWLSGFCPLGLVRLPCFWRPRCPLCPGQPAEQPSNTSSVLSEKASAWISRPTACPTEDASTLALAGGKKASCPFPRRVGLRLRAKSVGICAICIVLRSL